MDRENLHRHRVCLEGFSKALISKCFYWEEIKSRQSTTGMKQAPAEGSGMSSRAAAWSWMKQEGRITSEKGTVCQG